MSLKTLEIPFLGMALWAGWRYYKIFVCEWPADFEQEAVVAALQCARVKNDNEAFRTISRHFAKALRAYGYATGPDRKWRRRELVSPTPAGVARCGLPECANPGPYRDPKYRRLCARHAAYVRLRRDRGDRDPYQNIGLLDRRKPTSRLVHCGYCGAIKRERMKRLAERAHSFCSPACYHAWRKGRPMSEVKAA